MEIDKTVHVQTRQDWRKWLSDNHHAEDFKALPELYVRVKIDNIQSVQSDASLYHKRLAKFIEHTRMNKM